MISYYTQSNIKKMQHTIQGSGPYPIENDTMNSIKLMSGSHPILPAFPESLAWKKAPSATRDRHITDEDKIRRNRLPARSTSRDPAQVAIT